MRRILSSRLFRCLVCLILVCSLLIMWSPLRAEAALTESFIYGTTLVPGLSVIAAILIGLGILAYETNPSFENAVNDCFNYIQQTTSFVSNGMIQVLGVGMALNSPMSSWVQRDLVQSIWEWTSLSGTVTLQDCYSFAAPHLATARTFPYYFLATRSDGLFMMGWGRNQFNNEIGIDGNDSFIQTSGKFYYFQSGYDSVCEISSGIRYTYLYGGLTGHAMTYVTGVNDLELIQTLEGLMLGQFAPAYIDQAARQLEEAEEYEEWATEIIEFPPPDYSDWSDPDDKPSYIDWIKVGIGAGISGMIGGSQDQSKVQDGETDLEFQPVQDPGSNPDPGTDPDVDPDVNPDPDPSTNTGSGSWTPPSDYTQFQLVDLKNFFPFCIPFDLFHFFELLYAEPVAPVLHWEMADLAGKTYSITIDLSEWNSVAQLFRRLQLFLFVCGLAAASRKFIKW